MHETKQVWATYICLNLAAKTHSFFCFVFVFSFPPLFFKLSLQELCLLHRTFFYQLALAGAFPHSDLSLNNTFLQRLFLNLKLSTLSSPTEALFTSSHLNTSPYYILINVIYHYLITLCSYHMALIFFSSSDKWVDFQMPFNLCFPRVNVKLLHVHCLILFANILWVYILEKKSCHL